MHAPEMPSHGLIATPKGLAFALPTSSTSLRTHGRRIFTRMLSVDQDAAEWLRGQGDALWAQSRVACAADVASASGEDVASASGEDTAIAECDHGNEGLDDHGLVEAVDDGAWETGIDTMDAARGEVSAGGNTHGHGAAAPSDHPTVCTPSPNTAMAGSSCTVAPSLSQPKAPPMLPIALVRSGTRSAVPFRRLLPRLAVMPLSRRSTVREMGEWIARHIPEGDALAPEIHFTDLVTAAGSHVDSTGGLPSAQRLFFSALWMATTHNNTAGASAKLTAPAHVLDANGSGDRTGVMDTSPRRQQEDESLQRKAALGELPTGRQIVLRPSTNGGDVLLGYMPL
jgi:hypothetical protein